MIFLAWMSSAVLFWIVLRFLARSAERKCYSAEQEDSLRPLSKAIIHSRSWVRNCVNSTGSIFFGALCRKTSLVGFAWSASELKYSYLCRKHPEVHFEWKTSGERGWHFFFVCVRGEYFFVRASNTWEWFSHNVLSRSVRQAFVRGWDTLKDWTEEVRM